MRICAVVTCIPRLQTRSTRQACPIGQIGFCGVCDATNVNLPENDTNVQSKGSNSVGMVLVGAVLDVHSKKSWPPVCEKMLLNMPVMTMVRFA